MRRTRGPNATKRTRTGFCAGSISQRRRGRRGFGNDISASLRLHAPGRVTEIGSGEIATETPLLLPNQGSMFSVPDEVRRPPVERSWFDWLNSTFADLRGLGDLGEHEFSNVGLHEARHPVSRQGVQ